MATKFKLLWGLKLTTGINGKTSTRLKKMIMLIFVLIERDLLVWNKNENNKFLCSNYIFEIYSNTIII